MTRASSLDWNLLDFFYQLCGFRYFKEMFTLAEKGIDEGPICNLSLISQYLARFTDEYSFPISGEWVGRGTFSNVFTNFLYILFRRRESEYEDAEDPFPQGRIPFITIHQAKGLEFPVVVLANPRKNLTLQPMEELVKPLLRRSSEPLDRMPTFDVMRMFYVSLSRAKDLLILAHFQGQGQHFNPPFDFLDGAIPRVPGYPVSSLPAPRPDKDPIPQSYSYTGDFLLYRNCPRQYMVFRKYGFVPSRSQTMFFGSLVHQTLEDLHQQLIGMRT
jgi:DNA helicase-2/ATP-dependent DNA helicase PcrA